MNSNAEFGLSVVGGGKQHLPILDFLKGFSISTIVLFHLISDYLSFLPTIIKKASLLGGTGVHVFFLCSGIGLGLSFFCKTNNIFIFYKKTLCKNILTLYSCRSSLFLYSFYLYI